MDPAFLANFQKLARDPAALADFMSYMQSNMQKSQGPADNDDDSIVKAQLDQIKNAKEVYKRERLLPPSPAPPPASRFFLQMQFENARKTMLQMEREGSAGGFQTKNTFIGSPIDFSTSPISSLTRIKIRDMMVRKRHLGNYFLGRIITPANRIVAIQFAAEDPEGDAIHISFYHFPASIQATSRFLDAVLAVGTTFIIREPMLKIPSSGGNPMIRVDSPSDIVFVSDGDPILDGIRWQSGSTLPKVQRRPTTLEKWKALGDQQFREKQFLGAVLSYTEGIKLDATNTALLLNRAMAYLRLEFFSRALNDCRSALQLSGITDQDSVKALYRAGRALYGLGDWTSAKACFEDALKVNEAEKESRTWSAKCDARVREQETGEYEVVEIYRRSKSEGVRVDVADFVGNIEVASMKSRGGGRGVIATRELKAGELLVVAKPFASVFEEDFQGPKEMLMVFNLMTDTTDAKCHGYLISKITTMLFSDSSRADLIYHLYAGPSLDKPPSTYPPETNMTSTTHQSSPLFNDQVAVDVSRIEGAASFNGFSPTPLSPVNTMEDDNKKDMDKLNSPSALYTLPSLFNHSCVPNCTQIFLGDVMMIRALQDIPEGTELTVSYGNDGNTFQKRIKHLKKWFNKCDCSLCEAERSDGAAANKTREEVLTKIKKAKQKPATRSSLQEAKRFVSQVQATYKGSTQSRLPRVALYTAHFHLGNQYRELGQNFELIEEHINAIKALGVKVIDESTSGPVRAGKKGKDLPIETDRAPSTPGNDEAVMTCLRLTAHFRRGLGDNVRAERWLRAARWIDNVRHGGGVALFTILYEEVLELWEISDLNRVVSS